MTTSTRHTLRRGLAVVAVTTAGALGAPALASASFGSAISGTTVTMTGDTASDTLTIGDAGGVLTHNITGNGFNSASDFDNVAAGDQTLPADDTIALVVNAGAGDDTVTLATAQTLSATIAGEAGDDLLTGNNDADALRGGDGSDRVVGARGNDGLEGGAGNDTLVWNNGDGSDVMDGNDGLDRVEVNGAGAGDAFTLAPNGARAKFDRTNLVPFTLDIGSSELLDARGQGGDDTFTAAAGSEALLALLVDGGAGNDALTGSAGGDTLLGGSGDDTLDGGGGVDLLDGQDGADSLRARDGGGDAARCGAGADTVQTDAPGVDAIDGCETVDAAAVAPPPPPVVTPPDTKATPVTVVTRRATVRAKGGRRTAKLTVSCPAAELGGCTGSLTLLTAKPVTIGGVSARVLLGSARYALRAGQRRTLTISLPRGLSRLARRGQIAASAQTVTRDATGNVATRSVAVSLLLPAR